MAEIEVLLDEVRQTLDRVQTEVLEWKGRALGVGPALKVALAAVERVQWIDGGQGVLLGAATEGRVCAWCDGEYPQHTPDCERQVALKVLRDAIG